MKYDVLILADGLFPEKEEIQKLIVESPFVICCDGAALKLIEFGRMPDFVIGDLDSLDAKIRPQLVDRLIHVPDQDTNDLTKAVQLAVSKGFRNILIAGATGLREDHTLGNISLMHKYFDWVDSVEIISDFGRFVPINRSSDFTSFAGQQISIFSLTPQCRISVSGLRYPIENRTLNTWWMGTLNEATGTSFRIELHDEGQLIVYQAFR